MKWRIYCTVSVFQLREFPSIPVAFYPFPSNISFFFFFYCVPIFFTLYLKKNYTGKHTDEHIDKS